ncbi:MAG: hypothetical protein WBL25_18440, partial [Anaerolineales bacterium]
MSPSFKNILTTGLQRLQTLTSGKVQSLPTLDFTRIFHYSIENPGEKSRVHLRMDTDGHGTLVVNANRVMHLNPTAALMAWLLLEKTDEKD